MHGKGTKWLLLGIVYIVLEIIWGMNSQSVMIGTYDDLHVDAYFFDNFPWGCSVSEAGEWLEKNGYEIISENSEINFKSSKHSGWEYCLWNYGGFDAGGVNNGVMCMSDSSDSVYEKYISELDSFYEKDLIKSVDSQYEYLGEDVIVYFRCEGKTIQCEMRTYDADRAIETNFDSDSDRDDGSD